MKKYTKIKFVLMCKNKKQCKIEISTTFIACSMFLLLLLEMRYESNETA